MEGMMSGIPDLRTDSVFIGVQMGLEAVRNARIAELRSSYGIQGIQQTGGCMRPELGYCSMYMDDMFDRTPAKAGDIVALGYVYTLDEARVLICKLKRQHQHGEPLLECPDTGYSFEWTVDPLCWHEFPSARRN